jgi:hypothetical protein
MPKGEKVLAQSKRTAPPPNFTKNDDVFKLVSYYVQKGEIMFKKGEKVVFLKSVS